MVTLAQLRPNGALRDNGALALVEGIAVQNVDDQMALPIFCGLKAPDTTWFGATEIKGA